MSELSKFPDQVTRDQFVPYLNADDIDALTASLAHTICQKYLGKELAIISVLKGSLIFTADFVRKLHGVQVTFDFVKLSAIGRTPTDEGTIIIDHDVATNVKDKHVLIVEEIIDTGRALKFLVERIQLGRPKSIEILTLFDKPYKRSVSLKPDYVGKTIEDGFLVGYGLDLQEYGRNLKDVYFLKYPN